MTRKFAFETTRRRAPAALGKGCVSATTDDKKGGTS